MADASGATGGFWSNVGKHLENSFKPASARADADGAMNRQETGDQLNKDMQETPLQRKLRLMKGFNGGTAP